MNVTPSHAQVLPAASRAAGRIPLEFLRLVIAGDPGSHGGSGGGGYGYGKDGGGGGDGTPRHVQHTHHQQHQHQHVNTTATGVTSSTAAAATTTGYNGGGGYNAGYNGGDYCGLAEPGTEARTLSEWRLRLSYLVFETLGRLRVSQMFDIVVDYPDSLPAVRDLAACLRHTNLQVWGRGV